MANSRVIKDTQGYSVGNLGYHKVLWGTLGYSRELKGALEYSGVLKGTLGYSRYPKSSLENQEAEASKALECLFKTPPLGLLSLPWMLTRRLEWSRVAHVGPRRVSRWS